MTMLKTPYNFVPLSPFVLYPEWASLASHDHPFVDGLSGHLSFSLTTKTSLSVGGQQEPATADHAGKIHFYRTPEGTPAIPGSTLKGMLRNVLATAAFGRMSQIEERKFSVRDILNTGTHYYNQIVKQKARAGWLRFHQGQWQVQPCQYTRLHQQELINAFGLEVNQWKRASTVKARYGLLKGLREIQFDIEPHKTKQEGTATAVGKGAVAGTVVVTGQPGQSFDGGRSAKKWEFIFYQDQESEWFAVPDSALSDFLFVHENSEEWAFFQKGEHGQEAIPVFWHGSQAKSMTSMGLAQMYRLAQKNSLHDALRNTSAHHLDDARADLPELIFGRLRPGEGQADDWGLRGRVNIGMLVPDTDKVDLRWTKDTVLSSPKPSFYPAYLKQEADSPRPMTLDSKAPELRGWKRYPVKPERVQSPPSDVTNKVKVSLETVSADTNFNGTIRFHNLRPVELGALLWVLDFGRRDQLCHSLGTGKPYGLGQAQLSVHPEQCKIIPNDRTALKEITPSQILEAARRIFIGYMDSAWLAVTENGAKGWEKSPQVNNLLAMADPEEGENQADMLTYFDGPKGFTQVKQSNEHLALYGEEDKDVAWNVSFREALPSFGCDTDLQAALVQAEEEALLLEEQARLKEERAAMNPGDAILSQITEAVGGEFAGKTIQKNTEKLIRSILKLSEDELPALAAAEPVLQAVEIYNAPKLNSACNKVRSFLSEKG